MENETKDKIIDPVPPTEQPKKDYTLAASILISTLVLAGTWIYTSNRANPNWFSANNESQTLKSIEEKVLPSKGVVLPARWGDLGSQLVSAGVIDADKLKAVYEQRGAFTEEDKTLLLGKSTDNIKITKDNAGYLLNLFWALGLANRNSILETGEMVNPTYGGPQNFASTGGWTISKGNPMDHYSRHQLLNLTPQQQTLVEKVSQGIYRPCCGNSTHFPDCNHGMAMLGLLELMASQGASEQDMWKAALAVNSYWFPDNYRTIALFMKSKNIEWENVSLQTILGASYSSLAGYKKIADQVAQPKQQQSSGGCGVDAGASADSHQNSASIKPPQTGGSGCGI